MITLAEYNMEFLDRSWNWLNDPELKHLTQTPEFSKEEQIQFYKSLPKRADYWIKGVMEDRSPIGAMGLKKINGYSAEYWGYLGEKSCWGKGYGKFMIDQGIQKAMELNLKELYLHVLSENNRAKALYTKMGFKLSVAGETEKYLLIL